MIRQWLACVLVLTMTAQAAAAPVSIMVMPIDGDADSVLRTAIAAAVERVVKSGAGENTVQVGGATFAETAAAVGCDPATPECAESVRTTLSVDELVWGTATLKDGQVTVVIRKKVKEAPPEDVTTTIAATDPGEKIEPAIGPLFGTKPIVTCPDNAIPGPDGTCQPKEQLPPPKRQARTDRALGITALIGSGVLLIGGLTLWNEKSKKQGDIDDLPTNTVDDFQRLEALEDDAGKKALYGNLLVFGAVAAGVVGFYLIRRDRRQQRDAVIVTPTVTPTSAGVLITIGAR
ncbi:MAG: hypothetical protein H0V17_23995 [Deltaproteobacteria bacterium]|nr:hypothetical protein [Deltaproteobacteria bacterium]